MHWFKIVLILYLILDMVLDIVAVDKQQRLYTIASAECFLRLLLIVGILCFLQGPQ